MSRPRPDCHDKALALLGARAHFRAELERKLVRAGYEAEEIAAALARLAARGWLDDDALARARAEQLREGQGLGRRRVAHDLLRRGVAPDAVDAALGPERWPDELDRAREAAARWRRRGGTDPAALARHLDRKGFSRRAIVAVLEGLGHEVAADAAEEPAPRD
jgi:regulatory protein